MRDASIRNEPSAKTPRGFGLAATLPEEVGLAAAAAAEENGYHSFWLNNPPGAQALIPLGKVAKVVSRIWLGVGVIPLSSYRATDIVKDTRNNNLPLDRSFLGIGSGAGSGGVQRVADGIRSIRAELDCRLVVAALGPRMGRLAGKEADGVLFNWLTPEYALQAVEWVKDGAADSGRNVPRVMAYVRVALGNGAIVRLRHEAANYESFPHYAQHFKRMGVSALETSVAGATAGDIETGLAAWDSVVDELIVRAITADDSVASVMRLLTAAGPGDPGHAKT
jgi:alkanesulfonate monooxygenase SsuD/methylene tetrahydromethanopterin reductase-like flavin-dependent oxidoreductase (luciferase family)